MFVSKFEENWLAELQKFSAKAKTRGNYIYLLLDGAFIPSFCKRFPISEVETLFPYLPGFDARAESVSPFIVRYHDSDNIHIHLSACSGWPMVSAIETPEQLPELAVRLSECCIVEADGQRFNLRFADTRRIETISVVLSSWQKPMFFGPALEWKFVGRDGRWHSLNLGRSEIISKSRPPIQFSIDQYSKLIDDSLVDELLSVLSEKGVMRHANPFDYFNFVKSALAVVWGDLNFPALVRWIDNAISNSMELRRVPSNSDFESWRNKEYESEVGG